MRMTHRTLMILTLGAAAASGAGACQGADLVLDCAVHASRPDHGRTEWRRRLIVDPATRQVRVLDDFGSGFAPRARFGLAGVTPARLILENSPAKVSYVDRRTGQYSLRDRPMNFTLTGRCAKGRAP
jgi:hypothetical protein